MILIECPHTTHQNKLNLRNNVSEIFKDFFSKDDYFFISALLTLVWHKSTLVKNNSSSIVVV